MGSTSISVPALVAFVALATIGATAALRWPADWNLALQAFLLNLITTLMGTVIAVLVAIFIVERYLADQRRRAQARECLRRSVYLEYWRGFSHGSVGALAELVMHLSFLVLYGRSRWGELMMPEGETSEIPEKPVDFVRWLGRGYLERDQSERKSGGMGEDRLAEFEREFDGLPTSQVVINKDDLAGLVHLFRSFAQQTRDELHMFEPFMLEHMRLARGLLEFARCLDDAASHGGPFASEDRERTRLDDLFYLSDGGKTAYSLMGKAAINVIRLLWAVGSGDEIEAFEFRHQ